MFPFWGFLSFVSIFGEEKKIILACCSPYTSSTMPCPSKKAAQAFAQCQASQGVFSTAPKNISESDDCSAYHTSNGETEQDSSDEDNNTQSVTVMQALMANHLPAEMKARWEASEQVSNDSTTGPHH